MFRKIMSSFFIIALACGAKSMASFPEHLNSNADDNDYWGKPCTMIALAKRALEEIHLTERRPRSPIEFEDGTLWKVQGNFQKKSIELDPHDNAAHDNGDWAKIYVLFPLGESPIKEIHLNESWYYSPNVTIILKEENKEVEALLAEKSLGEKKFYYLTGHYRSATSDLGAFLDVFVTRDIISEDIKSHLLKVISNPEVDG
tara:strand:+ start:1103 stop:1705 length:603 start_codon:yes stop_codon:yes gene_type:complete